MSTSSIIIQSYVLTDTETQKTMRFEDKVSELLEFNKINKGGDFLTPLSFYFSVIEDSDPVLFPYMSPLQKAQALRNLQVALLLLSAQLRYELERQKTENKKHYEELIKQCNSLIDRLKNPPVTPEQGLTHPDKPGAYLWITLGQWFAAQMVNIADRKTKSIKETMGKVNEKRLYWVWASIMIKTTLELIPEGFFNNAQAKQTIRQPDPYTGTMSWGLYYFRFFLNLGLLLKHTISGPWMSAEEKSIPWTERFKTQWAQRKFSLLNDLFWATGNLVCFFWLCGKGAAGAWGDLLTVALLVFDIALAVWDYEEQKTSYEKSMHDYKEAIDGLTKQIEKLNLQLKAQEKENEKDKIRQQIMELEAQRATLQRAQSKCNREWSYQKIMLAAAISYAVGLMIAFSLLTGPFLPLAAQTLFSMTIAGAVLCFAFSVIYNGTRGGIELHKTKTTINEIKDDRLKKIAAFLALKASSSEDDQKAQKLLFLEVKKLMAETVYQEKMITYQSVGLMRSIIVESLIPAVVLLSLLFLPLGPGLGILAAAIALAVASHYIINAVFKPEKEAVKGFDEQEYKEFCQDPENWGKKPSTKAGSFFKAADTTVNTIDVPEQVEENDDNVISETQRLLTASSSASSFSGV